MLKEVKYGAWSTETMKKAIAAYRNGEMGFNEVCRQYNVPKPTLKRHLDGKNVFAVGGRKVLGRATDLPPAIEQELVDHILKLEEFFFGITAKDFRQLAFEVAEKNGFKNRFNKEKKEAGKKWYYNFMRRHPEVSLRYPENTSIAALTKERIDVYFKFLEQIVDYHHLDATKMFHMSEIGFQTVQKGKSQFGERGATTTAVCCVSAAGFYVPPMLIYSWSKSENFEDGAPPGTVFVFNPDSGNTNKEIFLNWMHHFVKTVKPTYEDPVLLLCDGHSSHTKSLEATEFARKNGVIMLALPSHSRLQPLDVAFFKPLSTYFTIEIDKYFHDYPDRVSVNVRNVAGLFGKAYAKTTILTRATNAFRVLGLWPINKHVFEVQHFAPDTVFEIAAVQNIVRINFPEPGPSKIQVASSEMTFRNPTS